jgi:hypothetical protein
MVDKEHEWRGRYVAVTPKTEKETEVPTDNVRSVALSSAGIWLEARTQNYGVKKMKRPRNTPPTRWSSSSGRRGHVPDSLLPSCRKNAGRPVNAPRRPEISRAHNSCLRAATSLDCPIVAWAGSHDAEGNQQNTRGRSRVWTSVWGLLQRRLSWSTRCSCYIASHIRGTRRDPERSRHMQAHCGCSDASSRPGSS